MSEIEVGDNLEMMLSPNNWPCWPRLPMKRRVGEGVELGILYEAVIAGKYAWVPGASITEEILKNDNRIIWINKDSKLESEFKMILQAGWVVD